MKWDIPFRDRAEAGQTMAATMKELREQADVLVLALPRGGVPVAYEVANALALRLDLILVRKLGTPGHKEVAMGAIASGGNRCLTMTPSVTCTSPQWPSTQQSTRKLWSCSAETRSIEADVLRQLWSGNG